MKSRQILIVEPDLASARRLALALHESNSNWTTHAVATFGQATALLERERMDAVVADGAFALKAHPEFFRRAGELCPAVFRLSLSGNYDHAASLRLMDDAHQNIWKPCPDEEIRSALARAFALRDTLGSDRLRLLIAQVRSLPSLPQLYLSFLDEVRKREPSTSRLAEIIRHDIGLTAKLLQLVNSAFFGLPQKVVQPEDALLYLGIESVKSLVLSLQVFSLFDRVKVKRFSLDTLWNHSWEVGCLARQIATCERRSPEEIDTAFTAGLLHDVGKLVLISGVAHGWEEALETAAREEIPLWQAERSRLGACHAEVGAALLAMWGLSDPLVEAVAYHHEPEMSGSLSFTALTAVHAANLLHHKAEAKRESAYLRSIGVLDRVPDWRERFLQPVG